MTRISVFAICTISLLLTACAGSPPAPEPGLEVLDYGRGQEMQVATDADWNRYTKIILHAAPVEFRDNWKKDQERLRGKAIRDEDIEQIKAGVSGQLSKVMYKTLTERGGYEIVTESGEDVMVLLPKIVDLDVEAAGWIENSILESVSDSRGRMTIELVIRDSTSDKLLAVGWQKQSDLNEGEMDMTISVSNAAAFRAMSQRWANWVLKQLEEAKGGK